MSDWRRRERKGRERGKTMVTMTANVLELIKNTNPEIQEAQYTPSRINKKISTCTQE